MHVMYPSLLLVSPNLYHIFIHPHSPFHGMNLIVYIQAKASKLLTYLIHQQQHASGISPSSDISVLTIGPPLTL